VVCAKAYTCGRIRHKDAAGRERRRAVVAVLNGLGREDPATRLVDRVERSARPRAARVDDAVTGCRRGRVQVLARQVCRPQPGARVRGERLHQTAAATDNAVCNHEDATRIRDRDIGGTGICNARDSPVAPAAARTHSTRVTCPPLPPQLFGQPDAELGTEAKWSRARKSRWPFRRHWRRRSRSENRSGPSSCSSRSRRCRPAGSRLAHSALGSEPLAVLEQG
jgi:hypothetical protein